MNQLCCAVSAVHEINPLVQCLTNSVVMEITANVLLAVGASPAMCDTPSESADFAAIASAVLINAGTPTRDQYEGMRQAIQGATVAGTPWVLDPVAVGALQERTDFAREILQFAPHAIRGNASEIVALAGLGSGGRGVDATDDVAAALPAAKQLAVQTKGVVAISGESDFIVSAHQVTKVDSGHPLMPIVIGTGCALGALTAAYLGAAHIRGIAAHDAVVAAHAHTGAAGIVAGESARGPGSFAPAWVDALYNLTPEHIAELVTVQEVSSS